MLTRVLAENLISALAVWAIVYVADYYLTIIGAKLYRAGADRKLIIEGSYELNPVFQKDIDALRLLSPQFWLRLLISIPMISLVWLMAVPWLQMPQLFAVGIGAFVLREVPVLVRHVRNVHVFRHAASDTALQGQIRYARWFSLSAAVLELWQFAVLFGLIALLVQEWFFLGGVLGCVVEAARFGRLAGTLPRRSG